MNKSNIIVFVKTWLGTSETFIYNQLKFVNRYVPLIIASNKNTIDGIDRKFEVKYLQQNNFQFLKGVIKRKLNLPGNLYKLPTNHKSEIIEIIKEKNIKFIHAHYGDMGLRILPVAQELNIPIITTFHGNDTSQMLRKKTYKRSLKYLFDYKYSYLITVSEKFKNRLISLGADRDRIIAHYIGTDLSQFEYKKRIPIREKLQNGDKIKILQVSNFVEKKGHLYTIKAFKKISKEYPNIEMVFGGNGPTKDKCEELVTKLNLSSSVKFLGRIAPKDVSVLMNDADLFVHNSITGEDGSQEGIPTVMMEAMATGLPVLSTKHAGIPELVKDGETGFLSEEKNIEEYAYNMNRALHCDNIVIGKKAHNHVNENFNLKRQNKILANIYESIKIGQGLKDV